MDIPWFRIVNFEGVIGTMAVGLILQLLVEREYIIHEMKRKCLDIQFMTLASHKLFPGCQNIFYTYDILIGTC
jgi:hypothetical protein